MVRKDPVAKRSNIAHVTSSDIAQGIALATGKEPTPPKGMAAKIHQALQPMLNEMFFAARLILVEGQEDVAFIATYLNLLGQWDEYRRTGCHIVPVNGKSQLLQPLVIAKHMGIPTFTIFDADADKRDKNGSRTQHEKDNKALLTLLGKPDENPMPTETLWGADFVMWHSDIGAIVCADMGVDRWQSYQAKADTQYGHASNLRKNTLYIGTVLALAWDAGVKSPSLERLCGKILRYCR